MDSLAEAPGMIGTIDPAQLTGRLKGKFMIGGTSSGQIEDQSKARRLT